MTRVHDADTPVDVDGAHDLLDDASGPRRPPVALIRGRVPRLGVRSLTGRLVTGVVVLVLVVIGVVGAGTYVELSRSLNNRLDQQVSDAAARAAALFSRCGETSPGHFTCPQAPNPVSGTEWVAFLGNDGSVVARINPSSSSSSRSMANAIKNLRLTGAQRKGIVADTGEFVTVRQGTVEVRATAQQIDGSNLVVVTGLSTGDRDTTLSRLLGLELFIGGLAVLVALVATLLGVRFTMRGLRAVTGTAQDVASELSPEGAGLDRRVSDADDTTEVGQLATSFNTMLAAVETQFAARLESERRMRQFLADASHELRTPLTSIRGYAELARMQRAAGDASDDNIDRIESEGTRMSRLVEDLLVLARGDAETTSRTRRELVDVDLVIDDAVSGSRAAFPDRVITAELHGAHTEIQVVGDPDQLLRVIRNLVTNAAVHTAPERPIAVRGWRDGENVLVQVVDGGPGLPPEDAAHVFERFWRADKARTRARGGSGLGLSIVATIVRAHGGSVYFDSSVEGGSTVTVRLPSAESGEAGAPL